MRVGRPVCRSGWHRSPSGAVVSVEPLHQCLDAFRGARRRPRPHVTKNDGARRPRSLSVSYRLGRQSTVGTSQLACLTGGEEPGVRPFGERFEIAQRGDFVDALVAHEGRP